MKFTLLSTLLATACAKKPAQHLRALSGEGEDIMSMPASITPADPAAAWWGNDGHNSLGHLLGAFHHLDVENACGPYCPVPPTTTSTTTTTPTTTTVATTATTTSTSTGPVCDCLITNVSSLSNEDSVEWGQLDGDADRCGAGGVDGWDFELCLQTSDKGPRGAEQTTGTITLKSPTSCTDTPDEIVCVIDKFRVNSPPGWPLSKWSGPSIKVAGTASYDADGNGAQLYSCAVVLGKSDNIDAAIQFTLLPVGENTYHEWMYITDYPSSRFRDFQSETSTTTIATAYTDISPDIVQELNLCGLVAPVEEN